MERKQSTNDEGVSNLFLRNILREREELKEKRRKCEGRLRNRNLNNFRKKLVDLYGDVRPLLSKKGKDDKDFLKSLNKLQKFVEPVKGYSKAPLRRKFKVLINLMVELDDVLYEIGILDPLKEKIGGELK